MNIPLGTTYFNFIDISLNALTKNWAGFIKVQLQHHTRDGHALLKCTLPFAMTMEDGMRIIGRIDK